MAGYCCEEEKGYEDETETIAIALDVSHLVICVPETALTR